MTRTIVNVFIGTLVLAFSCASVRAGVIRFTPVASTDSTATFDLTDPLDPVINMSPGESVLIEAQVLDWGPDNLRTVQLDLDTAGLTSGAAGSLAALNMDSAPMNGMCDMGPQDAGLCPICGASSDFDGVYIDFCRNRCVDASGPPCDSTDFVHACNDMVLECLTGYPDFIGNMPGFGSGSLATNEETFVALVTSNSGSAMDDGGVHYVASFVIHASDDAGGAFTVEAFADGDPASDNGGTFTRNLDNQPTNGSDTLGRFTLVFPEPAKGEILFTPVVSSDPAAIIDVSDPLDPIVTMSAGESVLVEIQVQGWGPDNLRTVQVDMDTSGLTSGASGSLAALNMDSAPMDGMCDMGPQDAGFCPICGASSDFDGAYIDFCRNRCVDESGPPCDSTDFVHACDDMVLDCLTGYPDFIGNMPGFGSGAFATNEETFVALVTSNSGSATDDGGTHYVASFVIGSSADAEGLFTVEPFVDGDPDSDNGGTFTRNLDNQPTNGSDILGRFRVMVLNAGAPEACCFPAGGCADLLPDDCTGQQGLPQGPDTSCSGDGGCPAPPEIVHGDGQAGETSPCSGYIDPKAESTNGRDINLGLNTLDILFSEPVFGPGGAPLSPSDFVVAETGISFAVTEDQEPGGTGSEAHGLGNVSLNAAKTELTIHVEHSLDTVTVGHIHRGMPGMSGPVVFPFPSAVSPIDAVWSLSAADVADLQAGNLYVNLHSAAFPAGEIRGQIPGPNSVVAVDDSNNPLVSLTLDRFLSLQEWTTVQAIVQNAAGILITNMGDQGPMMNEPDRIDLGYLTADVNNNGNVNPLDLLKFKQFVNGIATPDCGTLLDFTDINRNGSLNPLDLLRFKQAINGITPPSTQIWAFISMNNTQP